MTRSLTRIPAARPARPGRPAARFAAARFAAAPLAAAALLALAACAGPPPPQGSGDTIAEIARSAARAAGLTPTRVSVDEQTRTDADGDRELQGYLAWMDVEECPEGQAVVRLTEDGYVQDIFGRYGCSVP